VYQDIALKGSTLCWVSVSDAVGDMLSVFKQLSSNYFWDHWL